ncbi:hypothetical protein QEN19_003939 [Hanseniaspora menglaensis]
MSYQALPLTSSAPESNLFNGIVIHINGFTNIDRVILIKLITRHGGTVCRIPRKKTTTYVLSDQDNFSKDGFNVIGSSWVIDCIDRKTLLPFDYNKLAVDCTHPEFINDYYSKSRLHFISMEKLQLRSKYLKILKPNKNSIRLIYYLDFDSFFASGSVVKYNRTNKYAPVDIQKDCVLVSNGSRHSEITSINYVAKNIICISRHDYFETAKEKYEAFIKQNPQSLVKFFALKFEFEEYRSILTKFYDYLINEFDSVIPMSVDEGMFFDYVDKNSINYDKIMKKAKIIKLKVKELTGVDVSISVTKDYLFLNKIILKKIKPNGIGICIDDDQSSFELDSVNIKDVPVSGLFVSNILKNTSYLNDLDYTCTIKNLKDFIKSNYGNDYKKFFDSLDNQNALIKRFIENVFLKKDDDILLKNKNGDKNYYTPKTVSCSINYHMNFTNLWDINRFVKRFAKYLVERLNNLTNFYESIKQVGVVVVLALEGNVVSKFGGMGNNVKRLSKTLTYDTFVKIDQVKCLEKLGTDFYTLIRLLVKKEKLNDIKGISLQVLKLKNNATNTLELPFNFIFKTPDTKDKLSPTKKISTHSKETLVKLIKNEDKNTLKELPLEVLQDLYFEQRFDFKSKSSKRKVISTNSNSLKKIKSSNNSPAVIVSTDIRSLPNNERLNVFEPISFQSEKSISFIKTLIKKWIRYSIISDIKSTNDDKELFVNFLKNLREHGQQSRLDNIATFMGTYLQMYQNQEDKNGVLDDWERFMLLKVLPMME